MTQYKTLQELQLRLKSNCKDIVILIVYPGWTMSKPLAMLVNMCAIVDLSGNLTCLQMRI